MLHVDFGKFPKVIQYKRALDDPRIEVPEGSYLLTEKMDGANAGVIRKEEGWLLHSRNTVLAFLDENRENDQIHNEFRGFVSYVRDRLDVPGFAQMQPMDHYFGEWLVPHTIKYPASMYQQFYLFDPHFHQLIDWGDVPVVRDLGYLKNPTIQELITRAEELRDGLDRPMEGVVLQPTTEMMDPFVSRFKYVFPEFKEEVAGKWQVKKQLNQMPVEERLAAEYPGRAIVKIIEKVEDEVEFLDKSATPKVLGLAWHDYLTEFIPQILKKPNNEPVKFGQVQRQVNERVKEAFFTKLDTGEYPQWCLNGSDG